MTATPLAIVPTIALDPVLRAHLRDGFALSSAEWSQKSIEATARGDFAAAQTFAVVALVADSAARGER